MNDDGPKKFIECLLPVTSCNLQCEYCYIIQEKRRTNRVPFLKYSPEHIARALSKERLGGVCYISICGAGETLVPDYIVEIVHRLLENGHYVNITTNGTLTNRFKQIINFDKELLKHLHFAFSFHYLELKNKNLLDTFFQNVALAKQAGCSFLVQFNLYDGYIPYLDEIKTICLDKVGALPQVAATRDESSLPMKLHTQLSFNEYKKIGDEFSSPLFDFTLKNFNIKRKEFCYAGDWSFLLNLETGIMSKCYGNHEFQQNIFENLDKPINFCAVGNNCKHCFCVNSSHFLSLGTIPSINSPSYAQLRNRESADWYSSDMKKFLSKKLLDNNEEYSDAKKKKINKLYKKSVFSSTKKYVVRVLKFIGRAPVFFIKYYKISNKYCYFLPQYEHTNIGDAAIALSQKEIISKVGYKIIEIDTDSFKKYKWFFSRFLNSPKRRFFLQGGGNMGNVWEREELYRRNIIKTLSKTKIIIFPQTIFYSDKHSKCTELNSVDYYNNERITLFVREKFSFEKAKQLYPRATVLLVPDTVLISHDYVNEGTYGRSGVLLVMRNDSEKKINNDFIDSLKETLSKTQTSIKETDMHHIKSIKYSNRENVVKTKLLEYQSASIVITDRLHGMIFSAITNTPCIVFENNNYKILGSYEWVKDMNNILIADNRCDISNAILSVCKREAVFNNLELSKYIDFFRNL